MTKTEADEVLFREGVSTQEEFFERNRFLRHQIGGFYLYNCMTSRSIYIHRLQELEAAALYVGWANAQ